MASTDPRPGPGAVASVAGIGAGLLFFLLLLAPWLIVAATGGVHCTPMPACRTTAATDFLARGLMALAPAILLAASLRRTLHWLGRGLGWGRGLRGTAPRLRAKIPWWALLGLPLAIGGGILLVWYDLIFYA